jgi:hypothetical protein
MPRPTAAIARRAALPQQSGVALLLCVALPLCMALTLAARAEAAPPQPPAPARAHRIAELRGYLNVAATGYEYDTLVPLLERKVAPQDRGWKPGHPRWVAVSEAILRDLHHDLDAAGLRAQQAVTAIWDRALDSSVPERDLNALLGFYHSARGRRYCALQRQLDALASSATHQALGLTSEASATPGAGALPASAEVTAARQRLLGLSLNALLSGSLPQGDAARDLLGRMILATQGRELDALALRYRRDLVRFQGFNRSGALRGVVLASGLAAAAWTSAGELRELQALTAAEWRRRAPEWRAAYAAH